ncbi:MAG: hypothetical protein AB7F51_06785, partial [Pseudorhodoplanes sp.]
MNSTHWARIGGLAASLSLALSVQALGQAWPNQGGSNMGQFPSAQQPAQQPAQPAATGGGWPAANPTAGGGGGWPSASPSPGGFGGPPPAAGSFGPPQQGGGNAQMCAQTFLPLRKEAETRAAAIKAASDRKAQRDELCQVFKAYVAAEGKVVKFVTENQANCGIPAEAVKMMKTNHGKSTNVRNQVCNAARAGAPAPRAP